MSHQRQIAGNEGYGLTERRRELALCPEEAHRAYVGSTSTNRAIKLKMLLVMDI